MIIKHFKEKANFLFNNLLSFLHKCNILTMKRYLFLKEGTQMLKVYLANI